MSTETAKSEKINFQESHFQPEHPTQLAQAPSYPVFIPIVMPFPTPEKPRKCLLDLRNVSVYGFNEKILDDISFKVFHREHLLVMGPNGSGKSSLLRLITGFLTPSSGSLRLLGKTYGEYPWQDLRAKVGFASSALKQLVQDSESAFDVVYSGFANQVNLWANQTPEGKRKTLQALKQVDLQHLGDRPWRFLSQGERQRLVLARALVNNPSLLILDEPCAGLDPLARTRFLLLVQNIAQIPNGPTIIFVTHHVEEILPEFSQCLLLSNGRISARGPTPSTLSSKILSLAFETPVRLSHRNGRYQMAFPHP